MNNPITPKKENCKGQINEEDTPILTRTEVLAKLAECINMVHAKIKKGRIRSTDKQKESMLKVQGYLTGIYLQGLNSMEIEELAKKISALEGKT